MAQKISNNDIVGALGGAYSELSVHTKVAVTTASSAVLLAASDRIYAMIRNNGGYNLWIGKGVPAVVGEGQYLAPGEWYEILASKNNFTGAINGIMEDGASVNVPVEEAVT